MSIIHKQIVAGHTTVVSRHMACKLLPPSVWLLYFSNYDMKIMQINPI